MNSADTCTPICGNSKNGNEGCDDGGTSSGDGCSNLCVVEHGYECVTNGLNVSICSVKCGDGFLLPGEDCDDGNATQTLYPALDKGCVACVTQAGWSCTGGTTNSADICTVPCGDGIIVAGIETCDDGLTANGDGCSSTC